MKITHIFPTSIRIKGLSLYTSVFWPIYFKRYLKLIDLDMVPDRKLIKNLIYTWGNGGFSAQYNYIDTLIEHANSTNLPIFECGSGLSTLLIGAIAKKKRFKNDIC